MPLNLSGRWEAAAQGIDVMMLIDTSGALPESDLHHRLHPVDATHPRNGVFRHPLLYSSEWHPGGTEWHPRGTAAFLLQIPSGSAIPGVGARWHLLGTRRHRVGTESKNCPARLRGAILSEIRKSGTEWHRRWHRCVLLQNPCRSTNCGIVRLSIYITN